jgi:hypothetical protein
MRKMVNPEQIIEDIIQSLNEFTFEFNIEDVKKKMVLREVPKNELKALGEDEIKRNFINGIFQIEISDNEIINTKSLYEYCIKNNIENSTLFINTNSKFLRWEITEDLSTPQIKRLIKRKLLNNNNINLDEAQKVIINKDIDTKNIEGYVNDLPVKVSNYIQEGKFYVQITETNEDILKLINESIKELRIDKEKFIKTKIKRDKINAILYFLFVIFITFLSVVNNYCKLIPNWLSIIIGAILSFAPLGIFKLINCSFILSVFNRSKAEKKYEDEFNHSFNKVKNYQRYTTTPNPYKNTAFVNGLDNK